MAPENDTPEKLDERFQDEIYDPYLNLLLYYFKQQGCSSEDSWDHAHETFYRAYRAFNSFNGEHPKAWTMKIAFNYWLNEVRRKKTLAQVPLEDHEPQYEPGYDDRMISKETEVVVNNAVENLPGQMKEIVKMRHYDDLSYQEISVASQININTVKSHLAQAKQKLRKALARYVTFED